MTRRRLPILVALVAATSLAGAWMALRPRIRISGDSGDWRAVSTGLRRSLQGGALRGGPRAVIHVHDLDGRLARLQLRISALPGAGPLQASVWGRAGLAFSGKLRARGEDVSVAFPPGLRDAEVWIEAEPSAPLEGALFRIHEIVLLRQPGLRTWVGMLLPPLFGIATVLLAWRRWGQRTAVACGLLAAALALGLWLAVVDPPSFLRFGPVVRDALRLALLAALFGVAALRPRALAAPAIAATVGILYLPTLGYGFVYDDFAFARPWSWRELLSTFAGSWDPSGLSTEYFRPVTSATLALDYGIWGAWPPGFHLTNLVLHALLGWLVLRLLSLLGLSPLASLCGALAWCAHPLGACAVSWANQRTDGLVALFYVGALTLLLSTEARLVGAMLLYVLALGSKELAVTWPLAAALTLRPLGPSEPRPERWRAIRVAALLTLAYLAFWISLFPRRVLGRVEEAQVEASLLPSEGWKVFPAFFATVFAPTDYASWWQMPVAGMAPPWLAAGLLLPLLAWAATRRCGICDSSRLVALGASWPVVTALPMLGMAGFDLYAKGLLLCVGFGILWAVLIRHVEHRSAALAVVLAILPALWLGPLAQATSAAWGPGGFLWERNTRWTRHRPDWKAGLTPEMRQLFREQVEAEAHDERWVRSGR